MISHEHRCIFVHIPRTAGSSIEDWLCGDDWWTVESSTKHLTAHQTRRLYDRYWDDYFTFSFVRNPWDRMLSCLHFAEHFGVSIVDGALDFSGYEERFGTPVTLELDHRFYGRSEVLRPEHTPGAVYGNLLDEPLDFVGRFESLEADAAHIAQTLGIKHPLASRLKQGGSRPSQSVYDERSNDWVLRMFSSDLERFGYDSMVSPVRRAAPAWTDPVPRAKHSTGVPLMDAVTFTESRPSDVLANLHDSALAEREYLFASHDAGDRDLILVAWYQDRAVGYLAATDERPDGLFIWEHVVAPEFRQRGIGRRLVLEAAKRTAPSTTLYIDPMHELDDDRVADYYSQLGFPRPDKQGRVGATAQTVVARLGEQREDETTLSVLLGNKAPGVVTISPAEPVTKALTLMNEMRIGAIVASSDGSRVEGILSERDILQGIDHHGADFLQRTVAECTTGDVVTATKADLIADVMDTMTTRRIRHVPVTDVGRLVGIISVGDLLMFRLRELDTHRDDFPQRPAANAE